MATWQILTTGFDGRTFIVNINENETVDKLLEEVCKEHHLDKDAVFAQFGAKPLKFNRGLTLKDYNLEDKSSVLFFFRLRGGVKPSLSFDTKPLLRGLQGFITLTADPCCITLDEDPNEMRAKMPCGHAISVDGMTDYCQSIVDSDNYVFQCPFVNGLKERCTMLWDYFLVRHVACLDVDDRKKFEEKLHENFASRAVGLQKCPGCSSFCFREKKTDKVVRCPMCSLRNKKHFDFCWGCLQQTSRSSCPNPTCSGEDPRLYMLRKADMKKIGTVDDCPSVRACPTCGILIHHTDACKHMDCPICKTSFCFVCMKPKQNGSYQCGSWNTACEPAPVQKVIPEKNLILG